MIRNRCVQTALVEKARCADELTIPPFFNRTNSQKPDDELIQKFQRTFSDIIPKPGQDDSVDQAPNELVNPSRYVYFTISALKDPYHPSPIYRAIWNETVT